MGILDYMNYQTKTVDQSLSELKSLYENFQFLDVNGNIGIRDRHSGEVFLGGVGAQLNNIITKTILAHRWVNVNSSCLPFRGKINEYGVDAFNYNNSIFSGVGRDTFVKLVEMYPRIECDGAKAVAKQVYDETRYKYASDIVTQVLIGGNATSNNATRIALERIYNENEFLSDSNPDQLR